MGTFDVLTAYNHQKQNDAPCYLEILLDGANKPLNWAYEPLNGFKLLFSTFFFDYSYFATDFYVQKEESHRLQIVINEKIKILEVQHSIFFLFHFSC
jgi:hypothetical protein